MASKDRVIVESKHDALALRWLQMAAVTDKSRPVLTGMHLRDGAVEAADGFRVHVVRGMLEPLSEFEDDVIIRINDKLYKSGGRVYGAEVVEGNYPDISSVYPRGKLHAAIPINAEYLRDALEVPTDAACRMVTLKVYEDGPIVVEAQEGHYALVMPMHPGTVGAGVRDEVSQEVEQGFLDSCLMDWIRENRPDVFDEAWEAVEGEQDEV